MGPPREPSSQLTLAAQSPPLLAPDSCSAELPACSPPAPRCSRPAASSPRREQLLAPPAAPGAQTASAASQASSGPPHAPPTSRSPPWTIYSTFTRARCLAAIPREDSTSPPRSPRSGETSYPQPHGGAKCTYAPAASRRSRCHTRAAFAMARTSRACFSWIARCSNDAAPRMRQTLLSASTSRGRPS